tara:strand:- start:467 stop:1066 length:600 start_codon:yes stop_codon:yes gene_type:complete
MQFPKEISNIQEFDHGKRSIIYIGDYKSKKVAIKVKKSTTGAKRVIPKETKYLKLLNKHKIGPKFILATNKLVVYKFVEGPFFIDWLKTSKNPKPMIKKILLQCRTLDKLKINKKEFTRPIKHIIIEKNNPVFIDFERCYKTNNPKNVTQFCQFLIKTLKLKRKQLLPLLKEYKTNQTEKNFKKILYFLAKTKSSPISS